MACARRGRDRLTATVNSPTSHMDMRYFVKTNSRKYRRYLGLLRGCAIIVNDWHFRQRGMDARSPHRCSNPTGLVKIHRAQQGTIEDAWPGLILGFSILCAQKRGSVLGVPDGL